MAEQTKIVAVDGPAGSGKSSICGKVCEKLGWSHVNTGILYRSIGYLANEKAVDLADDAALEDLVLDFNRHFQFDPESHAIFYKDKNLTPFLEDEIAGRNASKVAQRSRLRELLLEPQRKLAFSAPKGAIIDGRDIGTVVFPDASLKIFMTASLEKRAERRFQQLKNSGAASIPSLETISEKIAKRDDEDENRAVAPMKRASDAILVDTSEMTLEETVDHVVRLIREKF